MTHSVLSDFSSTENPSAPWSIMSEIEKAIREKIESIGTPLREWDIRINFGIKTGFNDAFIISGETRDRILSMCYSPAERERTAEIIRPILRGRDIARYGYHWADLWVINTHNGIKDSIDRIHIEDYPAIRQHLDQYWDRIESRADQGDTPYNLRNCAYLDDLSRPKIIWGEISDKSKFCLDENGEYYPEATTFMLSGDNLYYLLAFLNCSVSEYVFSTIGTTTGVGTVRWKKYKILELSVPNHLSLSQEEQISNLCKEVVRLKRAGSPDFAEAERALNHAVYSVYGLTATEIEYIEHQIS